MRTSLIIFVLASLASTSTSCKKTFQHTDELHEVECTYCEIVDSIEGTYIGHLYEFELGQMNQLDTVLDSIVTVNVTRNYDYTGYVIDSTVCQFDLSYFCENPITIINNSGGFITTGDDKYQPSFFSYRESDNAFILNLGKNTVLFGSMGLTYTHPSLSFEGIRQ